MLVTSQSAWKQDVNIIIIFFLNEIILRNSFRKMYWINTVLRMKGRWAVWLPFLSLCEVERESSGTLFPGSFPGVPDHFLGTKEGVELEFKETVVWWQLASLWTEPPGSHFRMSVDVRFSLIPPHSSNCNFSSLRLLSFLKTTASLIAFSLLRLSLRNIYCSALIVPLKDS